MSEEYNNGGFDEQTNNTGDHEESKAQNPNNQQDPSAVRRATVAQERARTAKAIENALGKGFDFNQVIELAKKGMVSEIDSILSEQKPSPQAQKKDSRLAILEKQLEIQNKRLFDKEVEAEIGPVLKMINPSALDYVKSNIMPFISQDDDGRLVAVKNGEPMLNEKGELISARALAQNFLKQNPYLLNHQQANSGSGTRPSDNIYNNMLGEPRWSEDPEERLAQTRARVAGAKGRGLKGIRIKTSYD